MNRPREDGRSNAIYSFVVDGGQKFALQTNIFLKTLLFAGVSPRRILAQVTPSVSPNVRNLIDSFHVQQVPLRPIFDQTYCNKIGQFDALKNIDADFFVLCDTDLAFLDDLSTLFDANSVRAKPVDMPNPPIDILERVRIALNIVTIPRLIPTDCDPSGETFSTNCNGGLYIIPRKLLPQISRQILAETQAISDRIELLEKWAIHLDQVGFAMAMLRLGLDVNPISRDYNFPLHLTQRIHPHITLVPRVLHYHWLVDDTGCIKLVGSATVDRAIEAVNQILARPQSRFFQQMGDQPNETCHSQQTLN